MASTIQIRVDDDLKTKSDELFRDLGMDTTTAIRIFLTQAVAHNGFPFEIKRNVEKVAPYMPFAEEELLVELETARRQHVEGKYRTADSMVADMRTKYGL